MKKIHYSRLISILSKKQTILIIAILLGMLPPIILQINRQHTLTTHAAAGTSVNLQIPLTICPHGIGNCGDNVSPQSQGTSSPKHTQRTIKIIFSDANAIPVATLSGSMQYQSSTGNFQGLATGSIPAGQYLAKIAMDGYLQQQVPGILTVTASTQTISVPAASLITGDINNDNQLDILDYNILASCFGSKQNTSSCMFPTSASAIGADINDDGVVNGADYNLFLRELSVQRGTTGGSPTVSLSPVVTTTVSPVPITPSDTPLATPVIDRLEQITTNAKTSNIPNGWGTHKNRIIRLSTGDIFTVYVDESRQFHVMHRSVQGGWQDVKTGSAGPEPVNIVKGVHDAIHVFVRTGNGLGHYMSTDNGQTFTYEDLPGDFSGFSQGYTGAGANTLGDLVVSMSGDDVPGQFSFDYYSHQTQQWSFHTIQFDLRCTYAYYFPGLNGDLTLTCMRDVHPSEAGYNLSGVDYIFNQVEYFYIPNVTSGVSPQFTQVKVATVDPQGNLNQFADIANEPDSYMDTSGIVHIIYYNSYNGVHEALVQQGNVLKDVILPLQNNDSQDNQVRIIQDATGHFYVIQMNNKGTLEIYPGAAGDTDGTNITGPITLNNSQFPGCNGQNDDTCHSPMFAAPRNGHTLSNYIDGVYGNNSKEIYVRIHL